MNPALTATGLGRRYGSVWALHDCNLAIPPGGVVALVGPNGAGKTTLMRLAMGLIEPSAGSVSVFGWPVREQPEAVLPRVAYQAQEHPLYPDFKVSEMMKMGRKLNPGWDNELALARLRDFEIPLDQRVHRLSGGQQAQVALVMTLAKRAELLLLDEPTASLDPLARHEFSRMLMSLLAETNGTVVISSHGVHELERMCDHLVLLSRGTVQISGDIEDLLNRHLRLQGPTGDLESVSRQVTVLESRPAERVSTLLARVDGDLALPPA